jgi:uncharacterized membrane protein
MKKIISIVLGVVGLVALNYCGVSLPHILLGVVGLCAVAVISVAISIAMFSGCDR